MKVALVYDRVNKWGGAERVLLVLHKLFPQAPLYTSVYNKETAPWAKVFPAVIPSFLQKFPFAQKRHDFYAPLMPLAFESFDFSDYDLIISVTSEAAKGLITRPATLHICYCLTPTRYLWSGYDEYLNTPLRRAALYPVVEYLRRWDEIAAQRPDILVGISKVVCDRIEKYYNRKSRLIYPPVQTSRPEPTHHPSRQRRGSPKAAPITTHYLVVSRLVPYKKVDLVIKVFNKLGKPLAIVGTGSEERELKRIAKNNIIFAGHVSDEQLTRYYQNCKALIFPQEEDFGLTAVEAQSYGKPVIAFKKGGATETVSSKTGVFFERQTEDSLRKAIQTFESRHFLAKNSIDNAEKFAEEKFLERFAKLVGTLV